MPLTPGTRLGSCEILAPIGAGGMGEVYRARDTALGREVAVKVLPPEFASDADRLRRFTQEAQAAAALNHPNILAIHHVGTEHGAPFIVSELLEGETLRDRLIAGALPVRKAVEYAMQVASGLASAHDKGIVHRDLKPENLFITHDGRMKILDFGLAKLTGAEGGKVEERQTVTAGTGAGMVLGTVGYMSPEQVRAQPVDARTDLFSLGAILYEMVSGGRAFHGETPADTMSAILKEEPASLTVSTSGVPQALERVIRHCLEKNPYERFQSARDLKFDLSEILSSASGSSGASQVSGIAAAPPAARRPRALAIAALGCLALVVAAGLGWKAHRAPASAQPTYQRLTFRRGTIATARFAPDRKTIVYGAAWDGAPVETFLVSTDSPESRTLGVPGSDVYAVSQSSELALSLRPDGSLPPHAGTLARAPLLAGAAPREVMDKVEFADWGPSDTMAVTLDTGVGDRLEYPVGTMLYEAPGPVHQIRVAPDGASVAFWEVVRGKTALAVIDRSRQKRVLSDGWLDVDGLAWTSTGRELWFAAKSAERGWGVYSVSTAGELRLLLSSPGPIGLQDLSPDGRALLCRHTWQTGIRYLAAGADQEQELSWLDGSALADMSDDGHSLLFSEVGDAGGSEGAVYIRRSDGSPAVRLGTGEAMALSPDGKTVLATSRLGQELRVLPVGVGTARTLPGQFIRYETAAWLPDGRVAFVAMEQGHDPRAYVQMLDGTPEAISPEGLVTRPSVSPDGKRLIVRIDRKAMILTTTGGAPQPVTTIAPDEVPVRWLDSDSILVASRKGDQTLLSRVNLSTGAHTLVRSVTYTNQAGLRRSFGLRVTPDLKSYAYSYARLMSELYLVDGLAGDQR
jgi:eukaryotic-like serine/threonine-protein kinase